MQITLNTSSSAMFFLGDPKNLLLSLSYSNPGPVELDFESLDRNLQQKILLAVRNEVLNSDVPAEDLYKIWSKDIVVAQKTESKAPPTQAEIQVQQRMELEMRRKEKEDKFLARCDSILRAGKRAVSSELAENPEDSRLARTLLQMEQAGKNRKGIVAPILSRIKTQERIMAQRINREVNEQLRTTRPKRTLNMRSVAPETDEYTVVESDFKTVVLTPEQLIEAGARVKR